MDFERLRKAFSDQKVLVLGDHCLDRNGIGRYSGYSRERESLPIFRVELETFNPGGAGNLAANFAAMGVNTYVAGVWGDEGDSHRLTLAAAFALRGIDVTGMVEGARTPTFEKFYFHNTTHVTRIDCASAEISRTSRDALSINVARLLDICDFVVVADYDENGGGVCSRRILSDVAANGKLTIGTSRIRIGDFSGFDVLVINEKELFEAAGDAETESMLRAALLMSSTGAQNLVVTMGGRGAVHYTRPKKVIDLREEQPLDSSTVSSIHVEGQIDPCGCGDTFLAALSACVFAEVPYQEALSIANAAARAALQKLFGASPVNMHEVEKEAKRG